MYLVQKNSRKIGKPPAIFEILLKGMRFCILKKIIKKPQSLKKS